MSGAFCVYKDTMATQLIPPNLDPYIYINGVPLSDWCGWCMGYVASAYQIFGAASAHEGWVNAQLKHEDKNFPEGVYIPIWFDWYGNIDGTGVKNWGHVAIYKDGKVWSSPITHKPYADEYESLDALLQAFGGSLTYVGWSEDLNGTKVISLEGGDEPMIDDYHLNLLFQQFFGRSAEASEHETYVGKATYPQVMDILVAQQAYKDTTAALTLGQIATRDNWLKQIQDLQKQVGQPVTTLDPATKAEIDQTSQNVSWIQAFLNKIFK